MLRNIPQVTKNLLLINIVLYIVSLVLAQNGTYLPLAAHYFNSALFEPYQFITHMFMHDMNSFLHILFNMFLLVMFGAHLERMWGAKRFFIFYMASGFGAFILYNSIGVWQIMELSNQLQAAGVDLDLIDSLIREAGTGFGNAEILNTSFQAALDNGELANPTGEQMTMLREYVGLNKSSMVGASGAVFGLLAGFAMLFPNTELMLLFPPIPIKAKYLIGGYLAFEIYSSIYRTDDHIAHLAHVGGAIVGIIFILVWRRNRQNFW